jgi:hypothetical protein
MLKNVRGRGFSTDSISELFSLLERTVAHEASGIIVYVYNLVESALTTFEERTGKVIMEKCHIAYFSV